MSDSAPVMDAKRPLARRNSATARFIGHLPRSPGRSSRSAAPRAARRPREASSTAATTPPVVMGSMPTGSPVDRPCSAPHASTTAIAEAMRMTAAICPVTEPARDRVEAPDARSSVNVLSFWTVRIRKKKPTTTTPMTKVMPTSRPKVWLTDSTPGMASMAAARSSAWVPSTACCTWAATATASAPSSTVKATALIGTAAQAGVELGEQGLVTLGGHPRGVGAELGPDERPGDHEVGLRPVDPDGVARRRPPPRWHRRRPRSATAGTDPCGGPRAGWGCRGSRRSAAARRAGRSPSRWRTGPPAVRPPPPPRRQRPARSPRGPGGWPGRWPARPPSTPGRRPAATRGPR